MTSNTPTGATNTTTTTTNIPDDHSSRANTGGHGHQRASHNDDDDDFHITDPSRWHVIGSEVLGALLWFWLLYRLKNDWRYLFFWENPYDSAYAVHDPDETEPHWIPAGTTTTSRH